MDNLDANILTQEVESLASRYQAALYKHVLEKLETAKAANAGNGMLPSRVLAWSVFLDAARDAAEDLAIMHFADSIESL